MDLYCDYFERVRKPRTKRASSIAASDTSVALVISAPRSEYSDADDYANRGFDLTSQCYTAKTALCHTTRSCSSSTSAPSPTFSDSSPLYHIISPLSNLSQMSSTADLGDSIRLFHHFTTWIVPQLEESSPFFDMASGTWRNEIAMMTFSIPSMLHAILALSAKDLELKSASDSPEQMQKRYHSEWHEGRALMHLSRDLGTGNYAQDSMPWTILLLSWLCIISNRQQTAVRHLNGVQQLLTNTPMTQAQDHLGKELSHLFLALDMTRACMRNLSTRPLAPASNHVTKRLVLNASISGTLDELLLYQMLDIIASLPGSPDCTYLEYATDKYVLPEKTISKVECLIGNLSSWRAKAKQSPSYKSVVVEARPGAQGKLCIIFQDPLAATLMVYYHWSLIRLIIEPRYWHRRSIAIQEHAVRFIQGVVRGALSKHPSTYSSRILNSGGALNVFRPLYNCTVELDEELENDLLALNTSKIDPTVLNIDTVLNLNTQYLQQNHQAVTACWKRHFGTERFIADMFLRRSGEMNDFRIMDLFYFEQDSPSSFAMPVNYYGVRTIETSSARMFVLTRTTDAAGIHEFELDEELTSHWRKMYEIFEEESPLPKRARTRPDLEMRIESMIRAEMELCEISQ